MTVSVLKALCCFAFSTSSGLIWSTATPFHIFTTFPVGDISVRMQAFVCGAATWDESNEQLGLFWSLPPFLSKWPKWPQQHKRIRYPTNVNANEFRVWIFKTCPQALTRPQKAVKALFDISGPLLTHFTHGLSYTSRPRDIPTVVIGRARRMING